MIDTTGVGNTFLVVAIYGSLANWINRDILEPFVRFAAQA
jgi:sugar/nucleoside kinase (ribokinase family)